MGGWVLVVVVGMGKGRDWEGCVGVVGYRWRGVGGCGNGKEGQAAKANVLH